MVSPKDQREAKAWSSPLWSRFCIVFQLPPNSSTGGFNSQHSWADGTCVVKHSCCNSLIRFPTAFIVHDAEWHGAARGKRLPSKRQKHMCKCELWLSVCNETTRGVILSLPPLPVRCPSTAICAVSGCSHGFPAQEASYLDITTGYNMYKYIFLPYLSLQLGQEWETTSKHSLRTLLFFSHSSN